MRYVLFRFVLLVSDQIILISRILNRGIVSGTRAAWVNRSVILTFQRIREAQAWFFCVTQIANLVTGTASICDFCFVCR